jgi:hypothetical protein
MITMPGAQILGAQIFGAQIFGAVPRETIHCALKSKSVDEKQPIRPSGAVGLKRICS